jgi:hypothetical protein
MYSSKGCYKVLCEKIRCIAYTDHVYAFTRSDENYVVLPVMLLHGAISNSVFGGGSRNMPLLVARGGLLLYADNKQRLLLPWKFISFAEVKAQGKCTFRRN